jgi:hypothetical protein
VAETADLKSLARKVLQRDAERDNERDSQTRKCLAAEATARQHPGAISLSHFPIRKTARQHVPAPYARTMAALRERCPDLIEVERWRQCLADGEQFLAQWGEQAAALGWAARDLFGLMPVPSNPHPSFSRLSRYDETGLLWLLQGREVVALTESTAAIMNATSNVTTYRKHHKPALGPVGDSLDDLE